MGGLGRSVAKSLARIAVELVGEAAICAGILFGAAVAIWYPRHSDQPLTERQKAELIAFYTKAYLAPADATNEEDSRYVQIAERAAKLFRIREGVEAFAIEYKLADKRVLDVGAGRAYLQDVVEDYTALDISPSARRFCRKQFVLGSATAMPFPDNTFDAAWSIWMLEHVPNPEQALREMRRVVKPGGLLYLRPAWLCSPFAAQGYTVRPFSDFDWPGKFTKATARVRDAHRILSYPAVRVVRWAQWKISHEPTRFRYQRLVPNYGYYWEPDSDAINSLDAFETELWFKSRGDECLNCDSGHAAFINIPDALIIRVRKN